VILYLDTSAFVKLVVEEAGSADTRAWFAESDEACSSVVTLPEATAALCRQSRDLGATEDRLATWLATLEACWQRSVHVPVFERSAARIAVAHALRGMDAVQLASASELRAAVLADTPGADIHFLAYDRQLTAAAEREGFATLGPTD